MPYSFSQEELDFLIINISIFYIPLFYVYGYFTRKYVYMRNLSTIYIDQKKR